MSSFRDYPFVDERLRMEYETESKEIKEQTPVTDQQITYDRVIMQSLPPKMQKELKSQKKMLAKRKRIVAENVKSKKQKQNTYMNTTKRDQVIQISKPIPQIQNTTDFISVNSIDPQFRYVFPFSQFNTVQSKCFKYLYDADINMVISSPTGSGKTTLFELAILRMIKKHNSSSSGDRRPGSHKAVYMAPVKALCQERCSDWGKRLTGIGLKCFELTGDTDQIHSKSLEVSDLIITTPEKWDSVTRKWKDRSLIQFIASIELLLIDEVHLLDDQRGSTLEAVVSRMKCISNSDEAKERPASCMRIIALSATIPNIRDISEWINAPREGQLTFGEEYRPCQLDVKAIGYKDEGINPFIFDRNLNYRLLDLVTSYSEQKPTLIFCATRKGCSQAAIQICKDLDKRQVNPLYLSEEQRYTLTNESKKSANQELAHCIRHGVGFHSAGMSYEDRQLVETLFKSCTILILCTTSTLSVGINLPVHLVILKGTKHYTNQGMEEYSDLSIRQMLGRAGRPQFDTRAKALILTGNSSLGKLRKITDRSEMVESQLPSSMAEHLNAEIVLQTVSTTSIAVQWLKSTFYFVRLKSKTSNDQVLEKELQNLCLSHLEELSKYGTIEICFDGVSLKPTNIGMSMARYYINFETMKLFSTIRPDSSVEDLLDIVSNASEFIDFSLRQTEKKVLNELNSSSKLQCPVRGVVKSRPDKIKVLIQCVTCGLIINDWAVKQQALSIAETTPRIIRCLIDYVKERKYFLALKNALVLSRHIDLRKWHSRSSNQSNCFSIHFKQISHPVGTKVNIDVFNSIRGLSGFVQILCGSGNQLYYYQASKASELKIHMQVNVPSNCTELVVSVIPERYEDRDHDAGTVIERPALAVNDLKRMENSPFQRPEKAMQRTVKRPSIVRPFRFNFPSQGPGIPKNNLSAMVNSYVESTGDYERFSQ